MVQFGERSLTSFEMTNAYFSCHSERKRGIFLDVKTHGGLKMNHYRRFVSYDGPNLLIALLRALSGDEKKLICRSLARFGASVFFFLEKIQLRRYYSGANR